MGVELEEEVGHAVPEATTQVADGEGGETPAGEAQQQEIVVALGGADESEGEGEAEGEKTGEKTAGWIRQLRKQNRELHKQNREYKRLLGEAGPASEPPLGTKPTLAACDYDTDKYEAELESWTNRKRAHDEKVERQKKVEQEQQAEYQAKVAAYNAAKAELDEEDFDDAEEIVIAEMSTVQQSIIVSGAKNPALVILALGRNPEKAKELAAIKDPVKFTYAIAQLEANMRVTGSRKPVTTPEPRVVGTGRQSGAGAAALERLHAQALESGDFSKYLAAKRAAKV